MVAAALAIVDRDGASGLTMRTLGTELDVDPMAAYHHVPNKDAVLDGVVEAIWAEVAVPEPSRDRWQEQMEAIARSIRSTLRRHPNALPIIATRPNLSTPGYLIVDHILGVLHGAGLPPGEALAFVNASGEFLLGHALAETSPPPLEGDAGLMAALEDAGAEHQLPNLRRAFGQARPGDLTMDVIFDTGIRTLIRGLESRLDDESKTRGRARR